MRTKCKIQPEMKEPEGGAVVLHLEMNTPPSPLVQILAVK